MAVCRMATIDIRMPKPHAGQAEILRHPGSAVVFAGRRYGKTQMAVYKILKEATRLTGLYWWVGLSWRSASLKRAWRLLKFYARKIWQSVGTDDTRRFIHESHAEIKLPNGSEIWMRTAANTDSLAGEGVRGVVLDEFSLMDEIVWTEYVEGTLIDFEGWALFIGVPKGRNWAANLFGKAFSRAGWIARRFTTYDNLKLPRGRIEEIRENTPDALFRQEYLAEVMDDAGTVFRGVMACATAPLAADYVPGARYVFGVDWAKDNDYTVIVVFDVVNKRMVAMDRFNQVGWHLQRARLMKMAERWRPQMILAEANSIGSVNIEALQLEGLPVQPFMTTSKSKGPLIESLSLAIERQDIAIQPDPVLVYELQAYEQERMAGGFRYSAPSGQHDDTVIALALAWYAAKGAPPVSLPDWLTDYRG